MMRHVTFMILRAAAFANVEIDFLSAAVTILRVNACRMRSDASYRRYGSNSKIEDAAFIAADT